MPWAQPQSYPEETQQETEKPLFERVMEEERRRKEQGIKETVDAESLKANQATKKAPRPTEVKPLQNAAALLPPASSVASQLQGLNSAPKPLPPPHGHVLASVTAGEFS